MGNTVYIAASGAMARLRDLDVVANNLANAGTTGYKRDTTLFQATLEASLRDSEGRAVPGESAQAFVASSEVAPNLSHGPTERTNAALDVAIEGDGYFEIETPRGLRYTRAGSFALNSQRELVTQSGHRVLGAAGPIVVPNADVMIAAGGVLVDSAGAAVGRLRVVTFDEPSLLSKEGANLLRAETGAAANDALDVGFMPGSLERSNVKSVTEMGALVVLQRAFQINLQAMRAADEATAGLLREFRQ